MLNGSINDKVIRMSNYTNPELETFCFFEFIILPSSQNNAPSLSTLVTIQLLNITTQKFQFQRLVYTGC